MTTRLPIAVTHLITDLDLGGAEAMLAKLVGRLDPGQFRCRVISLLPPGPVAEQIRPTGIPVESLDMHRGIPDPAGFIRLVRLLRRHRPTILQTWLYHADLLGTMACRLAGCPGLVWNIRCSSMDMTQYSRISAAIPWLLARISGQPDRVLVNSKAGLLAHEGIGYRPRRWDLIPNGFDTERFAPDSQAPDRLRRMLGLASETLLVGLPARLDPMKDHAGFLDAARVVSQADDRVWFLLIGRGLESDSPQARALVAEYGLEARVRLLGAREDMPQLLAGLDLVVLSSAFGEGFPNVLGEAMACATPCLTTRVGDAELVVGDTGRVVSPRSPQALAAEMLGILALSPEQRRDMGQRGRERVLDEYSLDAVAARYAEVYMQLAADTGAGAA